LLASTSRFVPFEFVTSFHGRRFNRREPFLTVTLIEQADALDHPFALELSLILGRLRARDQTATKAAGTPQQRMIRRREPATH
jgi:hypothetical protein